MSKRLRLSAIAVPLFAIAPFPSLAQEDGTAPASQPDTRLEEVVVTGDSEQPNERLSLDSANTTGSRLNLTPRETPASVTIVDRATIEQRGATNTQEILGSVPGLTAASRRLRNSSTASPFSTTPLPRARSTAGSTTGLRSLAGRRPSCSERARLEVRSITSPSWPTATATRGRHASVMAPTTPRSWPSASTAGWAATKACATTCAPT